MSLPSDTELLPPSGAVTRLPALGSPELSTDYLARIKEILEALLGRRGGNGWDRVVTFRDLHEMGMQGGNGGGGMVFNMAGAETVDTSAPGFQQFVGRLSDEIMRSAAFKTLKARIGSAEDLAHLPEEIKRQLQLRLEQVARERQADIQTVEAKIQTNALSMASRLSEITAALDQYAAGVRQFDTAYADRTQAIALQVTQLEAAVAGGPGIEIEERLEAIASAVDGLKGQWSIKIQTNDPANPVIAGIALAVESPIAGPGTSSLIFMAETFGFVTENGTTTPFVIVGDQIEFNGNVRINGQLVIGPGGLQTGFEAPGTKNSDLAPALSAAALRGAALNDDPAIENPAAWTVDAGIVISPGPSGVVGAVGRAYFSHETPNAADRFVRTPRRFPIDASRTYSLTANLYAAPGNNRNMYVFINFFGADGNPVARGGAGDTWGGTMGGYSYGDKPPPGAWSRRGSNIGASTPRAIPATARTAEIGVWFQYSDGSGFVQQAAQDIRLEDVTAITAAQAAAATDATTKANAAQAAAITTAAAAAQAKADLAQVTASAYADGIVTAAEARSIADATAKANAAQAAAVAAAAADATAKANAAVVTAAAAAQAKADLAQTTAQAYADGKVTAEEARAIADATAKANAAQAAATAAAAADATAKANAAQAAAQAAANSGLAAKLNKNAADILQGPIALQANGALITGTLTTDANGYRSGGYGAGFTSRGIAAYNTAGVLTFQLDYAGGNPYFAGQLSAAYGTFGSVSIAAGGSLSIGGRTWSGGTGVWEGFDAGVPKWAVGTAGGSEIKWDGTKLTVSNPQVQSNFSVSMGNVRLLSQPNNVYSFFDKGVTLSGGTGPFTYRYTLSIEEYDLAIIGDPTLSVIRLRARGNNSTSIGYLTVTVTDAYNAQASATCRVEFQFGSGALQ